MRKESWITQGFEDFSQGTMGNAGQNLYVSKSGILQRIHQYDINRNGYFDLVFCNSQNHHEKPPVYVYKDPLGKNELYCLPSDGTRTGAVYDLNGDGYDDIILGMRYNGTVFDLNAIIYYGSQNGFSESRVQYLPVPDCTSVAVGDFNKSGKPDIAFISKGKLRIFYQHIKLGFEPKRYFDIEIKGQHLAAADLNGDGYCDLVVRDKTGAVTVYWGRADGINVKDFISIPIPIDSEQNQNNDAEQKKYAEYVEDATALVQVVYFSGVPYIAVIRREKIHFISIEKKSKTGYSFVLNCPNAISVAVGDINRNSYDDIAVASRQKYKNSECSCVYWGNKDGFHESNKTILPSFRACDVILGDLKGNGFKDIILCQNNNSESFTTNSLIYKATHSGIEPEPVNLQTEDARRVLLVNGANDDIPSLVFANHFSRNLIGNIEATIYFGSSKGFSPDSVKKIPSWGAVDAVCADLNDNGFVDIVLANASENSVSRDPGSYVYYSSPNGLPNNPDIKLPTTRAHGMACADINHDGYLDLIFGGFDNPYITIFYGKKDGFDLENPQKILIEHESTMYKEPRWIYLADLNNDGWLDLIIPLMSSDRSFVLWGGPEGFNMKNCQALSVFNAASARAADLNGNGYLDLIIAGHQPTSSQPHDSFVYIYWNGPDGLREDRKTLLPANAVNSMCIADFNNDGMLDLFVCSYHDGKFRDIDSYIYWNRKGIGFRANDRTRLFTHSASGCVAADFNEDGWVDLAVANHKIEGDHVGYSEVWWNGPDGFDKKQNTKLPTQGPHGIVSVGPGNIMDRGPEEYYISKIYHFKNNHKILKICWEADIPPKTWVKAQLRFAQTMEDLANAPWIGIKGQDDWLENGQKIEVSKDIEFLQYKLALGSINSLNTPKVRKVRVTY